MAHIHSRNPKRSAFTMVELLIVILIIAIMVSLLAAAVGKVMEKIPEVKTRTEISELEVALQGFMNDYNLSDPPPSTLVLYENIGLYSTSTVTGAAQSYAFLQKVFGKNLGSGTTYIDWNGDGSLNGAGGNPANPWILEGEQCLVFYVGGIPNTAQMLQQIGLGQPPVPGPQGFSTNNMNPAQLGGRRRGPYHTFESTRLKFLVPYSTTPPGSLLPSLLPQQKLPTQSPFFVYLDPWLVKANNMPYVYYSSLGINNGYTTGDCQSVDTAGPYGTGVGAYTYSNKYQIISAGKNGAFGGGLWNPSGGLTGVGADDQANFSSTLLGKGQN